MTNNKLINWFIPRNVMRSQTNLEVARIFVFTHLAGPLIAQPMAIFLYLAAPTITPQLLIMVLGISSFWALPFVLKYTGDLKLSSLLSFQGLTGISLFGTYFYGNFSSPFLPWLIVSLLLGFFYLYKSAKLVLSLFAINILIFIGASMLFGLPGDVAIQDLELLGWLSISAAMVYMTWMALYYSRVIALRAELETEAERYRNVLLELENAREVAEEMNRKRSLFLSKMSHELRTPLNVIIGYSDIMLEDAIADGHKEAQRVKDLDRINAAGKHLLALVSNVLDTDKLAGEGQAVDASRFVLGELFDDIIATVLPQIEQNGNQLVLDCPIRDELLVTDRTKLAQMLINLLSNAAKFTNNGVITFSVVVRKFAADTRVIATVKDTGIGIAPEVLPKLFDAYIQADATISKRFGGTGIGLAISRKYAALLGGEINVASKPGEGSTFTVDIPAHLTNGAAQTHEAA